jgi:CubicO group peptidase (beta-lactamase class C family)
MNGSHERAPATVTSPHAFTEARRILESSIASRAFPAAVIEVGRRAHVLWREAFGRLTFEAEAAADATTIFDLASLTKVIATATLAMKCVASGRLALDTPIAECLPDWRGASRELATIRHLLDHSSGLPAHRDLWRSAAGRRAFEQAICTMPLERAPGTVAVYSDLGFILLGFVLEDASGQRLDETAADIEAHTGSILRYTPGTAFVPRIAPTELDEWRGRLLRGDVHDENAAALGGSAGHAGLFGTAAAVGAFAHAIIETFDATTWLGTPSMMRTFASRTGVPGSSRALAWDTMLPTSSCGSLLSPSAIGHTGFTGTSLWIDWERDLYVVLLTNRVHPSRSNEALLAIRPRVHDAIVRSVGA